MWSWLPALIAALLAVVKGLWGTDRPTQVTTDEKPSPLPAPADADVLRDLGVTPSGATVSAGAGFSGGSFPTIPFDGDATPHLGSVVGGPLDDRGIVRLLDRSDDGSAVRDRARRPADAGDGKPDPGR